MLAVATALLMPYSVIAQTESGFEFKMVKEVKTTPVKNQQRAGTCWSYAATSFIETELLRMDKGEFSISPIYFARRAYEAKGQRYVRFQGANNFGQGGQAHDVLDAIRKHGMLTEQEYKGLNYGTDVHTHGEVNAVLKAMLDVYVKNPNRKLSTAWFAAYSAVLDTYFGAVPDVKKSPLASVAFNPNDYIEVTSYTNYPFFEAVELEIPDNWAHRLYHNVPLDDFMAIIDNAINNGYSVCWDGDVSEKGFKYRKGVAVLPQEKVEEMGGSDKARWIGLSETEKADQLYACTQPVPEMMVDQVNRQETFDNLTSTDDHLMHIVGIAKDQNGTKYYYTKNSWGTDDSPHKGYLYMSEPFVRMKTVAILVHKKAVPAALAKKMGI